jgi:hypothetical protein
MADRDQPGIVTAFPLESAIIFGGIPTECLPFVYDRVVIGVVYGQSRMSGPRSITGPCTLFWGSEQAEPVALTDEIENARAGKFL